MALTGRVRRGVAAGVTAAVLVGLAACSEEPAPSGSASSTPPSPTTTPLAARDLTAVTVRRTSFCGELAEGTPDAAVGGEVKDTQEYDSGEKVEVAAGVRDVVHEFSCGYTAADGSGARAWVFAPPVTAADARVLARRAADVKGCRSPAEAAAFGRPSVALVCREGGATTASFRGLFGDAWLTCSVSASGVPAAELRQRAEAWCGAVLDATSA